MDSGFRKLIERMEEFEQPHIRRMIPGRRELIKQLYEDFLFMFDDYTATLKEYEDELDINLNPICKKLSFVSLNNCLVPFPVL